MADTKPAKRRGKAKTRQLRKVQRSPRIPQGAAMSALAPKQRAFVRAYCGLAGGDPRTWWQGCPAARAAGYSPKSAQYIATELMASPKVQAAIDEVIASLQRQHAAMARRCIEELASVAFTTIDDVVNPETGELRPKDEISSAAWAAVSEISRAESDKGLARKVKMHNKVAALQLLMRAIGFLQERPGVQVGLLVQDERPRVQQGDGATIEQMSRVRTVMGLPAIDATASERRKGQDPTDSQREVLSEAIAKPSNGHARHAPTTADDDEQG